MRDLIVLGPIRSWSLFR